MTVRKAPDAGRAKPRGAAPRTSPAYERFDALVGADLSAPPAPLVTKTSELKLRATPELKARIVAECERRGVSVSAWITWLAERELASKP